MHVCEVEELLWNLSFSNKVHFPCLFSGPVTSGFWPQPQVKWESQASPVSSDRVQGLKPRGEDIAPGMDGGE